MSSHAGKTNAGSVNASSEDLTERSVLLDETRLEVKSELELGNWWTHMFPVLSGSSRARARNVTCAEYVRSQIRTRHLAFCDVLESRPVLSLNKNLVAQPFGDGLLPKRGTVQELAQPLSQRDLAAGDLNRPLQSGNVRFIHTHPKYTTMVVAVNNPGRVPGHKPACIVLKMPAKQKKSTPAPTARSKRIRIAAVGPDGKTLGDRVRACMTLRARQLGVAPEEYSPAKLIEEASKATGRNPDRDDPVITQQGLSLILTNQTSESHASIAFSLVFGVEPAWLQYGIGPQSYLERLLKAK